MLIVTNAIEKFSEQHELDRGAMYLVAVSGGRDSVSLLSGLITCGYKNLVVCHLNHGLRGEESDADEAFVRSLTDAYQVQFAGKKVQLDSADGSFEKEARDARCQFFAEMNQSYNAAGVFLGHHADDQAETILFNLLRGGAGLKGIKPISERVLDDHQFKIYRPLLQVSRAEIDQYMDHSKLEFREDKTNALPIAVRNRMRNEVMPLLSDIMRRDVAGSVNRAHQLSAMQEEYVFQQAADSKYRDPQGRIYLPELREAHRAIQYQIIFQYLKEQEIPQITYDLIDRAIELMESEDGGVLNLPGGHSLRRRQQRMFVMKVASND